MGFAPWQKRQALKALVAAQDNLCALCGHPFTTERPPTVDHIIPKSTKRAGLNHRSNLQAAHQDCNQIRSSMPMDEFRALVASGHVVLPDADGLVPSYRERRLRRKYGAEHPPFQTRSEERRHHARAIAALARDAPVAHQRPWRGESRRESKEQRNARLRSEVDAHLSE